MGPEPAILSEADLDDAVGRLIQMTITALDDHIPKQKPSPYSKQWFTPELKSQQTEVNWARHRWQDSCAKTGPHHSISLTLFADMRQKRRDWTRTIEKTKSAHWKEFLDNAGEGHLWKAATYMKPRDSFSAIPPLKVASEEFADNKDKARVFMESFFPKMADAQNGPASTQEEIPWELITELEIY